VGLIMTGFFPIPRSYRSDDIALPQGETETSARDWRIFAPEDLRVLWREQESEEAFVELDASAYTVTPASPETDWPAFPIVVLNEEFETAVTLRIRGARLYERLASVSQGGSIKGAALEREFSRIVVTLQEMRRDLNALEGLSVDVDAASDAREGAEQALASVRAIYLGELANDPGSRLDGSPLQGGEWYVRPDGTQRVYASGSEIWSNAPEGPEGGSGDMPEARVKGRAIGAGSGPPADLDGDAVRTITGSVRQSDVFGWVDPSAAAEDAGEITCDLQNGGRLFFTRTLADDETLLAPVNAPVGTTFYLLVDPGAHALTFAAGYEGPGDELPNIEDESLLAIVVAGASRFLVHVVGSDYGDGA
jgi:hypothetical protein